MSFTMFKREQEDTALMKDAISKAHLPKSVKSYKIVFDEDTTGEPALWVQLFVDDKAVSGSRTKLNELQTFMDDARKVAPVIGVSRRPYFRVLAR